MKNKSVTHFIFVIYAFRFYLEHLRSTYNVHCAQSQIFIRYKMLLEVSHFTCCHGGYKNTLIIYSVPGGGEHTKRAHWNIKCSLTHCKFLFWIPDD